MSDPFTVSRDTPTPAGTTSEPPIAAPLQEAKEWETFRAEFLRHVDVEYFIHECQTLMPFLVDSEKLALTPTDSFVLYLGLLKRQPVSPYREFDESFYLDKYPDVAAAVQLEKFVSGFHHWVLHGRNEGRSARSFLI